MGGILKMMGMRSIYLSIRAFNYTDRATRQVGRNIDKLIQKQQELRQSAVMMFSAGIMWTALGAMAGMAIMKIIEKSGEGRRAISVFSRAADKMLKELSKAFITVLGPTIKMLTGLFNAISKLNPRILQLVTGAIILGIVFLTSKGIIMTLTGAYQYLTASTAATALGYKQMTFSAGTATAATLTLRQAVTGLWMSMGKFIMIFTLFVMLGQILGSEGSKWAAVIMGIATAVGVLAAVLWTSASAMSILTWGAAALAGAAGLAMVASMETPSYQYGTRMVQRTSLAMVHAGDVITRPDRGDKTPQQAQYPRTINRIELSFGDIQTKADKEELRPLILKALKEALDNTV